MKKIAWLAIAMFFVSCGEDTTPVETESANDEAALTDVDVVTPQYQLVDVEYTEVYNEAGNLSIEQKRYEIFRDKTSFEQFFVQLKGSDTEVPTVDFEKNMIIVLFNGKWNDMRPIHHLNGLKKLVFDNPEDIHRTVLMVETTIFYYREECPVDQMIYYPTHIISVEKADFVNFVDHFEIKTDC